MYLSDHDLREAISAGKLIVKPTPEIGPSHIDVHLDKVEQAKVWDSDAYRTHNIEHGIPGTELRIANCQYGKISERYLKPPPREADATDGDQVFRREQNIIIRPGGFALWQTREVIGTPEENPEFVCFIDGRSTKTARTGLVVHLTAPTIHAGWSGNVTLEMVNLGPFDIVLCEGDAVAQLTVARLQSPPQLTQVEAGSSTLGQTTVTARSSP